MKNYFFSNNYFATINSKINEFYNAFLNDNDEKYIIKIDSAIRSTLLLDMTFEEKLFLYKLAESYKREMNEILLEKESKTENKK